MEQSGGEKNWGIWNELRKRSEEGTKENSKKNRIKNKIGLKQKMWWKRKKIRSEIKERIHKGKIKTTVVVSSTWNKMCKSLVCVCVCVCVCVSLFCNEHSETPVTSTQHCTSYRRTNTWNRSSPTCGSPEPVLLRFMLPLFCKLRYKMKDIDFMYIPNQQKFPHIRIHSTKWRH